MVPENELEEFVGRIREAAGTNLESVILYGSAVTGEFQPGFSNLNLFCVLRESSFPILQALTPVARWWERRKQPPPLFMTRRELERSSDVFTIELLDMRQHHRVLFGEDVLIGLPIPMHLHRVQVEYELREKLLLLRQQLVLASGDGKRLWDLLVHSVPSFVTLFRHALIALGHDAPVGKRDTVRLLAEKVRFDPSAIVQLLDVREQKANPKKIDGVELCGRYLEVLEQVVTAVDEALGGNLPARS